MDRLSELLEQSNQAGMSFLFTELETVMTFLSLAQATRHAESATRNRGNARLAYESVLRYQGRVRFEKDEQISFDEKLAIARNALIAAGFAI